MSTSLYAAHLESVVKLLAALNEIEKSTSNDPTALYMAGPIPLMLDGEPTACSLQNEIGDEWCLAITAPLEGEEER